MEVEGVSGGGLVKVRATAKGRIVAVDIDQSLLAPSEKQMLEDLVAAAFNDARTKADQVSQQEMSKMTAGIPLPPGFKLPFRAAGLEYLPPGVSPSCLPSGDMFPAI